MCSIKGNLRPDSIIIFCTSIAIIHIHSRQIRDRNKESTSTAIISVCSNLSCWFYWYEMLKLHKYINHQINILPVESTHTEMSANQRYQLFTKWELWWNTEVSIIVSSIPAVRTLPCRLAAWLSSFLYERIDHSVYKIWSLWCWTSSRNVELGYRNIATIVI